MAPTRQLIPHVRGLSAVLSALLSAWLIYGTEVVNPDAVRYLVAANALLKDGWQAAWALSCSGRSWTPPTCCLPC